MNILNQLNYPQNSKLLIIHADDAGLCHSENQATIQALENGSINSYSIMPPCPWFMEMANFAKANEQYDFGIHLTFTCEWTQYKWGPIIGKAGAPSLVNESGYFYKKRGKFKSYATIEEIQKEAEAQIERVLNLGLKPSHIDCHMFTLGLNEEFLEVYRGLGKQYNLPVCMNRELFKLFGFDADPYLTEDDFCLDHFIMGDWDTFQEIGLAGIYKKELENLPNGISIIFAHPAFDNIEMQAVDFDHPNFGSAWRQQDFDFFTSDECKQLLESNNIQLITWKEIKEVLYS